MYNGDVEVRDNEGEIKNTISKDGPVWCLAWNPVVSATKEDTLAVGCWDQSLSFYSIDGVEQSSVRLGYDPCTLHYFESGEYLVVGGSNKKVNLMTGEGVLLNTVSEEESWIWSAPPHPRQNSVVFGTDQGRIAMYHLAFDTVNGIYKERYAYRAKMTDIIVQHLKTDKKVRIKHKDYVKKIALYKDRIVAQLPDRIVIYELTPSLNPTNMKYRLKGKIRRSFACKFMAVTSLHVVLCVDQKVLIVTFEGKIERQWILNSVVKFIKVIGGPEGRECMLVGLESGAAIKIFVDNPFPIQLIQQDSSIRSLDLSVSREQLAIVNERSECLVYSLESNELVMKELNCDSAAWNTELEDMLCFAGKQTLSIRTGKLAMHKQKLDGTILGFSGTKIFALERDSMSMKKIDVPQSASLYRYLDAKDYDMAYKVACLGVTEADWMVLGTQALNDMNFYVARMAFVRIKNMRYIDLLNHMEQQQSQDNVDISIMRAEAFAYEGKFGMAAQTLVKAGHVERAINMYSDLWMWEDAKRCAELGDSSVDVTELNRRQALGMAELGDWKSAAEMYVHAGDYHKAVAIYSEHKYVDGLRNVARKLKSDDHSELLRRCAAVMLECEAFVDCKEVYLKLGDTKSLLQLYVKMTLWDEAFMIVKKYPGRFEKDVYLPYAEFLVCEDRFEEAQRAYQDAGRPDHSIRMLEHLTHNAVVERRFDDASYCFILLASERAKLDANQKSDAWSTYCRYRRLARLYYAYNFIYEYVDEPFTAQTAETLFNASRYMLNEVGGADQPFGISLVSILYTLSSQAKSLKAYKLSRYVLRKLHQYILPRTWQDEVELLSITIHSKPFSDRAELMPMCWRCGTINPLVNPVNGGGDACTNCKHPWIRSFTNFDVLPLVEFTLKGGLSDREASELLSKKPKSVEGSGAPSKDNKESKLGMWNDGAAQKESKHSELESGHSQFQKLLSRSDFSTDKVYRPVVVGRDILQGFEKASVVVLGSREAMPRARYFKVMTQESKIHACPACETFFHSAEFELMYLAKGHCPVCRAKSGMH
eukprot:g3415.t1